MLGRIAEVVGQLRQGWGQELEDDAVRLAMVEAGHKWRERDLNPVTTLRMFFLQVLFGNVACRFVPHLAGSKVTGSAYCEARGRLPVAALQTLLSRCTAKMADRVKGSGLWLGHRLLFMDGSSFSMSDTDELREHFGQPGGQAKGCGFPTAHWFALVHFGSGLMQKVFTAALRSHDLSGVTELHPELQADDVTVGDRAFSSYAHLAMLFSRGVFGIFRAHQKLIIDFTPGRAHLAPGENSKTREETGKAQEDTAAESRKPRSRWIAKLGPMDQIVQWFRPKGVPSWLSAEAFAALPDTLQVRELRYTIARPGFRVKQVTLVTTLLDHQRYSAEDLADAYGLRWTIETCFAHIKTTMKMDVLHCETVRGVTKELIVFLLVYNMVRMTMLEAARRQDVLVDRISFVDALRWLATAQPGDELRQLVLNPLRPGRAEPRVRKRRPKQYPLMKSPRDELRKALLGLEVAA
jgi:hypothetical protein